MAKKSVEKKIELIDLSKEVLISINGAAEKNKTISWDKLKNIGDKLEELVMTLAKYATPDINATDLNSFKLDFAGFYEGSAIPSWRLPEHAHNSKKVEEYVSRDFSMVMNSIDKEDYSDIIERFQGVDAKNDILKGVYEFTNSTGSSLVCIVKKNPKNNKFTPIYTVRGLNRAAYIELIEGRPRLESVPIVENSRVVTKKSEKTGKTHNKVSYIIDDKEEDIRALRFSCLESSRHKYIFTYPVLFQITKEGGGYLIENEQLDIFSAGENEQKAKDELIDQFEHSFYRLKELKDTQLSPRLLKVKEYFNLIIQKIEDK